MSTVGTCPCGLVVAVLRGRVQPHAGWNGQPCPDAGREPRGELVLVPDPVQLAAFDTPGLGQDGLF